MKFKHRKKSFDISGASHSDHIYKAIVKNSSFYEIDLLEYIYAINKHISIGDSVIIDVGANIGNHSVFFQSFLSKFVISVEPNPDVLPVLKSNLANNIQNFSIYDCALGEVDSQGRVVLPDGSAGNIGMAKVDTDIDGGDIKITTLDSMLAEWRKNKATEAAVSILKIDVEGMELAVLKGAQITLEIDKPQVFVEALTEQDFNALNSYLKGFDYKMLNRCSRRSPVYHFAYKPSSALLSAVRKARIRGAVSKVMRKISRKITRLKNS